jgi:hypothetical protein
MSMYACLEKQKRSRKLGLWYGLHRKLLTLLHTHMHASIHVQKQEISIRVQKSLYQVYLFLVYKVWNVLIIFNICSHFTMQTTTVSDIPFMYLQIWIFLETKVIEQSYKYLLSCVPEKLSHLHLFLSLWLPLNLLHELFFLCLCLKNGLILGLSHDPS